MSKNVSKEDLRKVNIIYKAVMLTMAGALAIGAMIYNPCHLYTAGLLAAYALTSEFVIRKDGGMGYE